MSLLASIARSLADDTRTILGKPADLAREIVYTIRGLREGTVSPRRVARTLLATVGATVFVAALLFPIYWILMSALSGGGGSIYSSSGIRLWPESPSLQPFLWVIGDLILQSYTITFDLGAQELFVRTPRVELLDVSDYGVETYSDFQTFLGNSLFVAIPTWILSMCLVVPGAYAFSRREFIARRKLLFGYVLFTQIGGGLGIAVLIALYAMFVQVGLNNNRLALAAYYAATAVPFNTWLLKTYMDGIPVSYEEAAVVDGAPPWRVVVEVILPMSAAGLATVSIFTFLTGWTEFVVAQTLLNSGNYTLPVGLFALVGEYSVPWARFSAFALLFASPIMVVYLFAQRYIEGGLSFGGVEG
jgi:arabinogalactan oligomer/maltooligosaccharide transport system permease protein